MFENSLPMIESLILPIILAYEYQPGLCCIIQVSYQFTKNSNTVQSSFRLFFNLYQLYVNFMFNIF